MTDEVTKEDIEAGVRAQLANMRDTAAAYALRACEQLGRAVESRRQRDFNQAVALAAWTAGFARACDLYAHTGHNDNVWTGRYHAYLRTHPVIPEVDEPMADWEYPAPEAK